MLLGQKFPGKAFMLTFVDACGIDLENDRRWEQAWDRLAVRYQAPRHLLGSSASNSPPQSIGPKPQKIVSKSSPQCCASARRHCCRAIGRPGRQ